MPRLVLILAAVVLLALAGGQVQAQYLPNGGIIVGPPIYPNGYGYNYGYNYGYPNYNYGYGYGYTPSYAPYPTYLPSGPSVTSRYPFSGSPNNGNYYYWLTQQAAQGRIPWSKVNQQMYGRK